MLTWFRENKRFLLAFGVVALMIFLALHALNNMYVSDYLQKRINYMSSGAFQSWLIEMKSVGDVLEMARTNLDVKEAMNYTLTANRFASILDREIEAHRPPNFAEHLYFWITRATFMLDRAVYAIATKPSTTLRNLDDDTLQKLENLTITIENLVNSVGTVEDGTHLVHPIQQLEEKDALDQVTNYVKQIEATSIEIWYGF